MIRLDESEVYRFWDIFKPNNELVEIRLIGSNKTASGYFTDPKKLIDAIKPYTDSYNVYFTINRINPACYGREQRDRIVTRVKNTTTDAEIETREYVLVDLDAKRLSGVCATKEEAIKAYEKGNEVRRFLKENGFYDPIVVFSSSGIHLYIRCALMNNEENTNLVKRFLYSLSMIFSDENVDVDVSVYNAARISRLMGSYSCKGSNNDPTRPQRKCRFLYVPDEVKVNHIDYFKRIADLYPKEDDARPSRYNNYSTERFDLEKFIEKYHIPVTGKVEVADGTRYYLEHCVFNEQHKGKDAIIFQHRSGACSYFCYHQSCAENNWRKFRELYEPDAYSKRAFESHRTFRPRREEPMYIEPQDKEDNKGNIWQTLDEIEDEDRSQIVTIPSGITQFDTECCGFDKPSMNVWSGNNGCGKSSLLNQLALNAVDKGFKVAIYSGELRGKKLKRWVLMQAAGKPYNKKSQYNDYDYFTPDIIKGKIVEWLKDKLYNYNTRYSSNIEQVCVEIEKLVKEKGVDMLIIDNLSCLDIETLDGAINEQQKAAIKMIIRLTNNLNVATHLIIHPKKSYGGYLRKEDVSGAKTLTDLADNVFFLHRWNQDTQKAARDFMLSDRYKEIEESGATNIIEVIKMREFGEAEGHIYKLFFEPESRRLKNSIAENHIYGWCNALDDSERKDLAVNGDGDAQGGDFGYVEPIEPNTAFLGGVGGELDLDYNGDDSPF